MSNKTFITTRLADYLVLFIFFFNDKDVLVNLQNLFVYFFIKTCIKYAVAKKRINDEMIFDSCLFVQIVDKIC